MNSQLTGTRCTSRTTARSTMAKLTKPQRARVLESTYCRRLDSSSAASCTSTVSTANSPGPGARKELGLMSRGRWPLRPRGGSAALHPEQVARLEEEAVRGAGERLEPEVPGLGEGRAVAEEDHGARDRPVGEQHVVAERVGGEPGRGSHPRGGRGVEQDRPAGRRILERILLGRGVLPHVPEEDVARQLILDLQPRDVLGRKMASVPGSGDALVHEPGLDPERRGGAPGDR